MGFAKLACSGLVIMAIERLENGLNWTPRVAVDIISAGRTSWVSVSWMGKCSAAGFDHNIR